MLSLLNRAKWLLGGNIIFAFSQWLMLIFFSRMSDPTQLGYYSYALAVTAPIFLLSNLQLRPLLVADLNTSKSFSFSQYFSLRIITIVLAIVVSLFFISGNTTFSIVVLTLVVLIKASEAFSDIIYAYYNASKKTAFISKSLTIKSLLVIISSFLVLYFTNNIIYSLIATLCGYILVLIFLDFRKNLDYIKNIKILDRDFKAIVFSGLPLGIAVMLVSLQTNIPRYFLEYYSSIEFVGIYTIFYYFLVIGGIIINSVCQYLSPYFSEYYQTLNTNKLKAIIIQAFFISLILGLIGLLISLPLHKFIIQTIYGDSYVEYSYLLPYIMLAAVFSYLSVVSGYLLTSLKMLKIQMPVFILLAFLTLLYSYVLIPSYGLLGAAYTTILSAATQFLVTSIIVLKRIREIEKNV